MSAPPVIAVDGPAASGKGTIAAGVARALGFHYLDSGALYRLTALKALDAGIAFEDEASLADAASAMTFHSGQDRTVLDGSDVTAALRSEAVSVAASRVAALPGVRAALLPRQRAFRQPPGLVADGRDMGTVVFPDALVKVSGDGQEVTGGTPVPQPLVVSATDQYGNPLSGVAVAWAVADKDGAIAAQGPATGDDGTADDRQPGRTDHPARG